MSLDADSHGALAKLATRAVEVAAPTVATVLT